MTDPILCQLEHLIRTDPGRRGLISTELQFGPLLPGHLAAAAADLADCATSVGIVTGFFIPSATPPAAETDGPLGACLLAKTFEGLGVEATLLTDRFCHGAVLSALRSFSSLDCIAYSKVIRWDANTALPSFSHLIAIERVGPNHTRHSIRELHPDEPRVWEQFEAHVPERDCNRCFNMRGDCIDEWTDPLHELFENRESSPRMKTIGIGDGGNEIGMGSIPWTELARRLPDPPGGRIACRVPCDWTIIAGVSNWGGYALAAAVAYLKGRVDLLEPWTTAQQWESLQTMVRDGPAVDGVTRLPEPTVDGLPFATYIQPWDAMRQLLGLPR